MNTHKLERHRWAAEFLLKVIEIEVDTLHLQN